MAREDWVYLPDEASSRWYYANLRTNETTWQRPAELDAADASSAPAPAPSSAAARASTRGSTRRGSLRPAGTNQRWVEVMDESAGQPYYYNNATGVTQWTMPTA